MYDSIQSGIGIGKISEEFRDENIIRGIYQLLTYIANLDNNCQLIIIDNHPPMDAYQYVRVRYTGDPKNEPYGLIDNEVSWKTKWVNFTNYPKQNIRNEYTVNRQHRRLYDKDKLIIAWYALWGSNLNLLTLETNRTDVGLD